MKLSEQNLIRKLAPINHHCVLIWQNLLKKRVNMYAIGDLKEKAELDKTDNLRRQVRENLFIIIGNLRHDKII